MLCADELSECLNQPPVILARLQRADGQNERPGQLILRAHPIDLGLIAHRLEAGLDAAVQHRDLLGGRSQQLDQIVLRRLRIGQHARGALHRARHGLIEKGAQARPGRIGIADEGQIVHGQQRRHAGQGGGQREIGRVKQIDFADDQLDGDREAQPVPGAHQPLVVERQTANG